MTNILFVSELAQTESYSIKLGDALGIYRNQLDPRDTVMSGVDYYTSDYVICTYKEYSTWITGERREYIFRRFNGKKWHILFEDETEFTNAMHALKPIKPYTWTRLYDTSKLGTYGYEVSTKGDKRFSPFVMRLPEGRTLEEYYQLDVKGYSEDGVSIKDVKGLPPKVAIIDFSWVKCYREYFKCHPGLLYELAVVGLDQPFTDMFDINGGQNRMYCIILNNFFKLNNSFKLN